MTEDFDNVIQTKLTPPPKQLNFHKLYIYLTYNTEIS